MDATTPDDRLTTLCRNVRHVWISQHSNAANGPQPQQESDRLRDMAEADLSRYRGSVFLRKGKHGWPVLVHFVKE